MALVNCPECGKTEISDSAIQCPYCGYSVKEHFEMVRRKERISEERQARIKRKQEQMALLEPELERELKKIDNMPYPKKPTYLYQVISSDGAGLTYLVFGILIGSILLAFMTGSEFFVTVFAVDLVIVVPFILYVNWLDYGSSLHLYNEQISDWEKYKESRKEIIRRDYLYYASNLVDYGSRHKPIANYQVKENVPKCSVCGSTKISKISTTRRMASIYVSGLASSNLGNQMKCEECGYKF